MTPQPFTPTPVPVSNPTLPVHRSEGCVLLGWFHQLERRNKWKNKRKYQSNNVQRTYPVVGENQRGAGMCDAVSSGTPSIPVTRRSSSCSTFVRFRSDPPPRPDFCSDYKVPPNVTWSHKRCRVKHKGSSSTTMAWNELRSQTGHMAVRRAWFT